MTIFNMTLRNVKKNFKNYWAYFMSSSFSVFTLYLFLSIMYSKNIQDQFGTAKKFVTLFQAGAVMIGLFSAFFIWYSNSFFIKSRKKEFATYMLLGMSKKQVSLMNLFENIIIMILSFATGIILGLLFNKVFIMLLFYMMRISKVVSFQFTMKAFKICIIIFCAIFLIVSLHGYIVINKSSLIDLFNAAKKVEKGLRVSVFTFILGIGGVFTLGYAYYLAYKKLPTNFTYMPTVVVLVVVGIILFFTSTTSLIISANKKNEKSLFSGTRLITNSQLCYRYRGNVGTLSMIAITTTVALCALVTCIGTYSRAKENSYYMSPFSIEYFDTKNADNSFDEVLKKHSEISVKYKDKVELLSVKATDPLYNAPMDYYIINQSQFNKINKHENINRNINLKNENDCYFIQNQGFTENEREVNRTVSLKLGSMDYKLKIKATDVQPFVAMDHFNETFVVTDDVYSDMKKNVTSNQTKNITGYMLKDDYNAKSFISDLEKKLTKENNVIAHYELYCESLKILGMMAFIGLFIGILFVTATGSIIYFKMNMEAREDKTKFITLSKIGVSRKEIKRAVSKELMILFGAPFVIAAVSTLPASYALSKMLQLKITQSYVIITIVYAVIYCIYYFVTLNSYVKTVTE